MNTPPKNLSYGPVYPHTFSLPQQQLESIQLVTALYMTSEPCFALARL